MTKRIITMSDIHGFHNKMPLMPDGDILLIAGDVTATGTLQQLNDFLMFVKKLPHQHKCLIAGNHDWCFEDGRREDALDMTTHYCTYLENSSIEIEGLKIWGSPYSLQFYNWAFMDSEKNLAKIWETIPNDTDIIMTHGPAKTIGDKTLSGDSAGSKTLYQKILKIKPKLFVFGHIHESYQCGNFNFEDEENRFTHYVNPSICDIKYRPVNKPIIVDLE